MLTLQLKFEDGKEEFLTVDNIEFDEATGTLIIGADGARYGIATNCHAYVWIGSVTVREFDVTGSKP